MVGVVGQDVQAVAVGRADKIKPHEQVAVNLVFAITLAVNLQILQPMGSKRQ
jgi:hypothetical protein